MVLTAKKIPSFHNPHHSSNQVSHMHLHWNAPLVPSVATCYSCILAILNISHESSFYGRENPEAEPTF